MSNKRTKRQKSANHPQAKLSFEQARRGTRQEIVALHRAIFKHNEKIINESVYGYTPAFKKYQRAYAAYVRRYESIADTAALEAAIAEAQIVYVGDYHTLHQARRSFGRLLEHLPPARPVTVALEFIQGRHQALLDAYMQDELSETQFLKQTSQGTPEMAHAWRSFRPILETAKLRGYRVIGINSLGSGNAGSSLQRRDRYAARCLHKELQRMENPDHLVMVLIGELHVAPCHLPKEVQDLIKAPIKDLVVYQNCEKIYFALEQKGLEHDVNLVRLSPREYCLLYTPPVICQQSFLNWLELDEETSEPEAATHAFKEQARTIAEFFDLPIGDALDDVEITTVADLSFLSRLRKRGDFSAQDMQAIRHQILRSESYYIPRARMAYLGNVSVNHTSEEATHFLRHVSSGCLEPDTIMDKFYARCIEEAVGFLGSKIINHKRHCPDDVDFARMTRSRSISAFDRFVARLVMKHIKMEQGQKIRGLREVYDCDRDLFNAVTHSLGYRLGNRLYYGLISGKIAKDQARKLFFTRLEEAGSGLTTYLYLAHRTKNVRLPERF